MQSEGLQVEQGLLQWHVLHVVPNHEKKVALHLVHRSIEHFLPLYTEKSRWTDRNVTLQRPLFPGYIFVRYTQDTRRTVITLPGALKILGRKGCEEVTIEEVERIRTALASGYVLRPHPTISVGTRVRVCNGIFEGTEGIVLELRSSCKVILSMAAVQQCYSLETDIRNVEILDKKVVRAENRAPAAGQFQMRP
jgi:transcription antitermination factor NusG